MYKFLVPYAAEAGPPLPERTRPVLRYRPEDFGYVAAFPDGKVAMYAPSAAPLLAAGRPFDECQPHLLNSLEVSTGFYFSAPLLGWIEITRRCNLRCPHCFVEGGLPRRGELPTQRILRLLDEWAEMGVFSVVITGGEPTVHRDFAQIVRYAHDLGFTVGIATNGMPVTGKLLSQLPQSDVIISVSIDELHGQGRNGESDFEFATRRIRAIRDQGFATSIMTTTSHDNIGQLDEIISWAVDNDVSLRSVPFVPMGRGLLFRELANTTADVETAARFWLAEEQWERVKDQRLGLCTGKVFNFLLTMVFATRRCMSGRGLCYVDSSGDVYPCTTCSGNRILCGGNIQRRSFADVWHDQWEIRGITWRNFEKTCEGCPINDDKYFCTGRCPSSSYAYHHTFDECGMTDFLRSSVHRREELFRQHVQAEPRVVLPLVTESSKGVSKA